MAKQEITVKCFLHKENGEVIDFSELSEADKAEAFEKMSKRLSEGMSRYYSQHLDEFERL